MVCSIHIFLLSPLSYKDKWTLNWRSICTIPLTLVFSCKRWKHSRPPVRVILAWKNRDEKIEASSEEGRRETQPAKDCSGSLNNIRHKIGVSNKILPGIACPFFLQYSNNLIRLSPVTTPAGTIPFKPMIFGLKNDVITLWVQLYWLQVNSVSMTWKATVDDDNTLITWPSWQCSKGHMLIFYW